MQGNMWPEHMHHALNPTASSMLSSDGCCYIVNDSSAYHWFHILCWTCFVFFAVCFLIRHSLYWLLLCCILYWTLVRCNIIHCLQLLAHLKSLAISSLKNYVYCHIFLV